MLLSKIKITYKNNKNHYTIVYFIIQNLCQQLLMLFIFAHSKNLINI